MVSIVAGSGLGIFNTSRQVLGAVGQMGGSGVGRGPNQVQVNASNGNLVLSARDDMLAGLGPDVSLIRTYNSQGLLNDDNGDNWRLGLSRKVYGLTGTINTAGSTIKRLGEDGFEAVYAYDTTRARYVNTDGAGAYDTLSLDTGSNRWIWTDGDTRMVERYDNVNGGRLVQVADPDGNLLTIGYNAAGLVNIIGDQNGETVYIDYDTAAGHTANITQIRTVTGTSQTRVRYGYDGSNRLTSVTTDLTPSDNSVADAKTFVTSYAYDGTSNRVASLIQSDGTRLDFTYITVGTTVRVQTIVDVPSARTTTFAYDTTTRKTTIIDPAGGQTVFSYDASDRLLSIVAPTVDGVAQTTSFTYDVSGNVTSATDARGNATVYGYDANGNRTLERDAMGNTIQRVYSAESQLQNEIVFAVADPDGAGAALPTEPKVTRYVYDDKNHLRFTIGSLGDVVEQRYNALGQRVSSIVYAGGAYATSGLTSLQTLAEAQLVTWASTASLALAERTDFQYDTRGQISRQTRYASLDVNGNGVADGGQGVLTYVYSQAGELLQTIDEARASELADTDTEWAKQYRAALGYRNASTQAPKLTAELSAGEKAALRGLLVTSYTYDGLGRLLSQASLDGSVLTSYDDANRTVKITQAGGRVVTQVYDAAGAIVSQSQAAAGVTLAATTYVYDGRGLLRLETDPLGNRTLYLFDAAGRQVGVVDAAGTLTETVYNANNQVSRSIIYAAVVDATAWSGALAAPKTATVAALRPATANLDNRVGYTIYNAAGQVVKTVDGAGAVNEFRYDGRGRRVETVAYANVLTQAQQTALSALTTEPTASDAVPTLDAINDRRERSFYDDEGRLQAKLDAEGYLREYFYDNAGRATQTLLYATLTVAANRAMGALTLLRPGAVADDQKTINLYNGKGQLEGVVDAEGYLTEYRYDNTGNRVAVTRYITKITFLAGKTVAQLRPAPNAEDQTTSTLYDGLNRVFRQTTADGALLQYTYDTDGRLKTSSRGGLVGEENRVAERVYDGYGRLVAELAGENREAYLAEWTARSVGLTPVQQQALRVELQGKYATNVVYDDAGRKIASIDPNGKKTRFYYDAEDRLVATVNAAGEVALNDVNSFGQVSVQRSLTQRLGATALGSLTGGQMTTALRASFMALLDTSVDRVDQWSYTQRGETASVAHAVAADGRTDNTYNAFGNLTRAFTYVSGSQTLAIAAEFDRRGLRTKQQQDPLGLNLVTQSVYDAFGRETQATDARGGIAIYTYDRLGRTLEVRDPSNALRKTTYDAHSRVLTQIDANGQATTTSYATALRTTTVTTPEGVVVTRTANRHGEVISIKDGRDNVTSYAYDRSGRQTGVTTPAGTQTTIYDRAGLVIETGNENGVRTTYAFDAANRVVSRKVDVVGLQLTTSMRYDGQGRTLWSQDGNGVWTQTEYDARGRVKAITIDPRRGPDWVTGNADDNPGGVALRTTYAYDGRGMRLSVVEGVGTAQAKTTQYVYDVLGRRTEQAVDPSGLNLRTLYTYDKNDNVVVVTSPSGAVTRYVYDARNRPLYVVDAMGGVTLTEYDAEGRVIKTTAYAAPISLTNPVALPLVVTAADIASRLTPNGAIDHVGRSVYDRDGRLVYSIDALSYVTTRVYDAANNVVRTVRSAKPIIVPPSPTAANVASAVAVMVDTTADRSVRRVYDTANRLVFEIDALGGVTENTYDAASQLVKTTAYANPVSLAGDPTIAQVRTVLTFAAGQDRIARSYFDGAGRPTYSVDALGNAVERQFDAMGRVTKTIAYATAIAPTDATTTAGVKALLPASAPASAVVNVSAYDNAGRNVFSVDAQGYVTELRYDAIGRVAGSTLYASGIAMPVVPSAVSIRSAVAAQNGAAGNIVNTFNYDLAGRLTSSVDAEGQTERFTYDANGNKLTFTNKKNDVWAYSYDALGHQYREVAPAVSVTTLDGNLNANVTQVAIETRTAFDAFGNVISRTEAFGRAEARTTSYDYDLRNRQVRIRYPQVSIYNAAADKLDQGSGAARIETVITPQVTTIQDGLGQPAVNIDVSGNYSYKVYDVLGRIRYEIDAEGYVNQSTYDAFNKKLTTTRYAVRMPQGAHANPAAPYTVAEVQAALAAMTTAQHADDRTITNSFDKLGRLTNVVEPSVYNYDASASGGSYFTAGRQTINTYDFRGNLVRQSQLKSATDNTWVDTTFYFDRNGRRTAQVDALGQLTTYQYDKSGYQIAKIEYARALAGGSWSVTSYGSPSTNLPGQAGVDDAIGYDRVVEYEFDKLGRNTREIRRNTQYSDLSGGNVTVNQGFTDAVIARGYDALGNQVSSTDAKGNVTFTYYDALGRTRAVVEPSRVTDATAGASARPVTEFLRDIFGNAVRQTSYANGVASADAASYSLNAADAANDKRQTGIFDSHGHQVLAIDAMGHAKGFSYYASGSVAREWETVTDIEGKAQNKVLVYRYDRLGNQTEILKPSSVATSVLPVFSPSGTSDVGKLLDEYGLIVNAFHDETGRGNYFNTSSGTSEGQFVLLRGAISSYQTTGDARWKLIAEKMAANLLQALYFTDDVPTAPSEKNLFTPHWLYAAKSAFVSDEIHYDKFFDVVNGEVIIPDGGDTHGDLIRNVFHARTLNSEYVWDNPYSDLKTAPGARKIEVASREHIAGVGERVRLKENFTGRLLITYTTQTGEVIQKGQPYEAWPYWHKLGANEIDSALDTLTWAYDTFNALYSLTGDAKWQNAAYATKVTADVAYRYDDGRSWLRPTVGNTPFDLGGTFKFVTPGRAEPNWSRDDKGQAVIDIPADIGDVQYGLGLNQILDGGAIAVEIGSDRPMTVEIFIDTEQGNYLSRRSVILQLAGTGVQSFNLALAQFKPTYKPNGEHQTIAVRDLSAGIAAGTHAWALGVLVTGFPASPPVTAGKITFRKMRPAQQASLSFSPNQVAGSPWLYRTNTTNAFDIPGSFSYASRNNGGTPIAVNWTRNYDGDLSATMSASTGGEAQFGLGMNQALAGNSIALQVKSTIAQSLRIFLDPIQGDYAARRSVTVQLNGTGLQQIVIPLSAFGLATGTTVYTIGISDEATAAHTLTIKQISQYSSGAPVTYAPAAIPFTANLTGEPQQLIGWRGPIYMGYQSPTMWAVLNDSAATSSLLSLLKASQNDYAQKTGLLGPFAPVFYPNRSDGEQYGPAGTFGWGGPDPNSQWGGYQYRALEDTAKYWSAAPGDATAQSVVMNFLGWINNAWTDPAKYPPTDFPENLSAWAAGTTYKAGDVVRSHNKNGLVYRAVSGGTVGASPPAWSTTMNAQFTDGGITWQVIGYDYGTAFGAYAGPHEVALMLRAAVYADLAGGSQAITRPLIARALAFLETHRSGGDMLGTWSTDPAAKNWYGFWSGEIASTLSLLLGSGSSILTAVGFAPSKLTTWLGDSAAWILNNSSQQNSKLGFFKGTKEQSAYNAFGEVVSKGRNDEWQESYTYDAAGRMWSGNSGGVQQIFLYNVAGQATAKIESATQDLKGYATPQAIAGVTSGVKRTTTVYDALGRAVSTTQPTFQNVSESSATTPQVFYTYDRWNNMLSMSDPRTSGTGLTNYRYNSSNQLTAEIKPEVTAWQQAGINVAAVTMRPTTFYGYDLLGRRVTETDANGNVTRHELNSAGDVLRNYYADGGVENYTYDVWGRKTAYKDAMGNVTTFQYDRKNRLVNQTKPIGAAQFTYDDLGNLIQETNANGTRRYWFDINSRMTKSTLPGGQSTTYEYDAGGYKVKEIGVNSDVSTWRYDYFGRLLASRDIGGADASFVYNWLGQVVKTTNSRGQSLDYVYYANGQLQRVYDNSLDGIGNTTRRAGETLYEYDAAGNVKREKFTLNGVTYQNSSTSYDAAGRISAVSDPYYLLSYRYDAMGNRRSVTSAYMNLSNAPAVVDSWYLFDSRNRITVTQGMLVGNSVQVGVQQGAVLAYDASGNRTMMMYYSSGKVLVDYYNYDALHRLVSTARNNIITSSRVYDAGGRVVGQYHNRDDGSLRDYQLSIYNANGWLKLSTTVSNQPAGISRQDYSYTIDAAGNIASYALTVTGPSSYNDLYQYQYLKTNNYVQSAVSANRWTNSAIPQPGGTVTTYDANGNATGLIDSTDVQKTAIYISDYAGHIYTKQNIGKFERYFYVNGNKVGSNAGRGPSDMAWSASDFAAPSDAYFTAISERYPSESPSTYTVQEGDSLRSIAYLQWGDSNLWYVIAEANGIASDSDLAGMAGRLIDIPNQVTSIHNNSQTIRPYSAADIRGDTTPRLPTPLPPPKSSSGGCGGFGMVVVAIVAVVATVFTAGAAAVAMGAVAAGTGVATAGAAVLTGGLAAGTGFGTYFAAAAIGGAVGSIVSQGVGIAIGVQDKFSWSAVAAGALGSGISAGVTGVLGQAGLGSLITQNPGAQMVANAALQNAIGQGVQIAVGAQKRFDWRGVAAAAISAPLAGWASELVGKGVDAAVGDAFGGIARQLAQGATRSLTTRSVDLMLHRGGKLNATSVVSDAFGNVIGQSLIETLQAGGDSSGMQEDVLGNALGDSLAVANGQGGSNVPAPVGAAERAEILGYFADGPSTDSFMGGAQGLKFGVGGYGFQPSVSAVSNWSTEVDANTQMVASRLNAAEMAASVGGNPLSDADLTVRKNEVERQVQLELLGQQAREDSLQGAQLFQTGGPGRGGGRGIGSGGFEIVRNGNWDAALNVGADPYGVLPDLAGLQQDMAKMNRGQAAGSINDMRQRMTDAGMKNVPGMREALVVGADGVARNVPDYKATVDNLQRTYEDFTRDQRLRSTYGDDYQNLRIGRSQMTPLAFEKRVLDVQQQSTDRSYERGVELIAKGELPIKGDYARTLGSYIDVQVRTDLRGLARAEGINDSMTSNIWAVNRSIRSDLVEGRGIPDNRLGYNLFADTTLARKSGSTEQIMKWNAIRPEANYLMVRPTQIGGSYAIPRAVIQPYMPPRPIGRSL